MVTSTPVVRFDPLPFQLVKTPRRGSRSAGESRRQSTPQRFTSSLPRIASDTVARARIVHGNNRIGKGSGKLTKDRVPSIVGHVSSEFIAMRTLSLIALFSSIFASGCGNAQDHWVELDGHRFHVEIADDDIERSRGLMFRESMDENRGMLFIHDSQQPLAYWMKNTKLPLDILYFDSERRLVSQQRDVPPCSLGNRCPPYPSHAPALYVLELNAGQAAKLGLKAGSALTFGPGIPPAD